MDAAESQHNELLEDSSRPSDEEAQHLFTLFESNEECICEFGDVILAVNDGFHPVEKLRVSSCVLAMSSKVFKVLFSKRFSEGQRVQDRSSSEPQEIELQDVPKPMRQLCQLLHHQSVEDLGTPTALFDFAIVVDKYNCAAQIRLQADALLQAQHEDPLTYHSQRLLAAAALLDQPRHFRHFGQHLILHQCMLQAKCFDQTTADLLPDTAIASLFNQQNLAWHELSKQVGALLSDFRTACIVARRETVVLDLISKLSKSGLLPPDPKEHTLGTLLNAFESTEIPVIALTNKVETPHRYHGTWHNSSGTYDDNGEPSAGRDRYRNRTGSITSDAMTVSVSYIDPPTQASLKEYATRVRGLCVGLCLDCIRGRECRESHRHTWQFDSWDVLLTSHLDPDEEKAGLVYKHDTPYPGYWEESW